MRYIRFPRLIAGVGSTSQIVQYLRLFEHVSLYKLTRRAHMCHPWPWRSMRAIAYSNNDLEHTAAHKLRPKVLIIDGVEGEKRRFQEDLSSMVPALRAEFPDAQIELVKISQLPGEEQMQLLSETTVLVTSVGSRSYWMMYLPDGAQVVLVGPPEFYGADGTTPVELPFREVDWCWGNLGYFNILLYRHGSSLSRRKGLVIASQVLLQHTRSNRQAPLQD